MPFTPHIRLTVRGSFLEGTSVLEQWAWGLNLAKGAADPGPVTAGMLTNAMNAVEAFWIKPSTRMGASNRVDEVKIAHVGADGKYTADPLLGTAGWRGGGTATEVLYPTQVALAVSLQTPLRGASGRGRFFLPAPSIGLGAGRSIGAQEAQDIAVNAGAMVQEIAQTSNEPGVTAADLLTVVIASRKGFSTPVNSVRVGLVLDTMRSRRTSLAEKYGPLVPCTTVVG